MSQLRAAAEVILTPEGGPHDSKTDRPERATLR